MIGAISSSITSMNHAKRVNDELMQEKPKKCPTCQAQLNFAGTVNGINCTCDVYYCKSCGWREVIYK